MLIKTKSKYCERLNTINKDNLVGRQDDDKSDDDGCKEEDADSEEHLTTAQFDDRSSNDRSSRSVVVVIIIIVYVLHHHYFRLHANRASLCWQQSMKSVWTVVAADYGMLLQLCWW